MKLISTENGTYLKRGFKLYLLAGSTAIQVKFKRRLLKKANES